MASVLVVVLQAALHLPHHRQWHPQHYYKTILLLWYWTELGSWKCRYYDPEYKRLPGTEILKLSTEEYFRRFEDDKSKALKTIKHLNNRVEMLQRELSIKEKAFKVEKEEAVSEVRKFWKNLVEGNTRSGKIVQMASRIRK